MTVREIKEILDAEIFCCCHMLDIEMFSACGSDALSDILFSAKDETVLLSGLNDVQLVRTAELLDMNCVILVRGKSPASELIELARRREICVMSTGHSMFTACGLLYKYGLRGGGECK